MLEHYVDGVPELTDVVVPFSHCTRNTAAVEQSNVARTFDQWIFSEKLLVNSDTDARRLEGRDKTLPTNIKRPLAHVITKWVIARHVPFKITAVVNC